MKNKFRLPPMPLRAVMPAVAPVSSVPVASEEADRVYLRQLRLAQDFLDQYGKVDLCHVQCLLRRLLPPAYHILIDALRQNPGPHTVVYVNGGNNVIAPEATKVGQQFNE